MLEVLHRAGSRRLGIRGRILTAKDCAELASILRILGWEPIKDRERIGPAL